MIIKSTKMYKKNEAKRFTLRCVLYQQVGVPRDTQLMSVWCILNGPAIPPPACLDQI